MEAAGGSDFSFPVLPPPKPQAKAPLTEKSTVVDFTKVDPSSPPQPVPIKDGFKRNKVPLEKGFSQVDWLRLTKSGTSLNGGGAFRKDITMDEVKQHKTAEDAWIVLRGKVYCITQYLRFHPGGIDILAKVAGKDATTLFNKYHPWVNADALLEKCLVGWLAHKAVNGA